MSKTSKTPHRPLQILNLEDRCNPVSGFLDTDFNGTGYQTTDFGETDNAVSIAVDSNGKIIALGSTGDDFGVARYTASGALDTSFGTNGLVTLDFAGGIDQAKSVIVDASGRIVVAGTVDDGGEQKFGLARFNSDGSLDTTFGVNGLVIEDIVSGGEVLNRIAFDKIGRILATGTDGSDLILVRFNTNGSLDTSLDSDGILIDNIQSGRDEGNAILVDDLDRIVVVGSTADGVHSDDALVARYLPDGNRDVTFDADGIATLDIDSMQFGNNFLDAAFDSSGRIVAGGAIDIHNFTFARFLTDGSLDTTFASNGTGHFTMGSIDTLKQISIDADGKIILAGDRSGQIAIARLTPDGVLDSTFATNGKFYSNVSDLAGATVDASGRLIIAGTDNGDFRVTRVVTADVNVAPTLSNVPPTGTVDEHDRISFTATANDPDLPAQTLTYSLIGAPDGASIDPDTGDFSWTPSELQGGETFNFTVRVSDGFLHNDQAISITVDEVNVDPVLTVPGTTIINELSTHTFTARVDDEDAPAQRMQYSLVGEPDGASIDPETGEFRWMPSELQGPRSYTFTVRVYDGFVDVERNVTLVVEEVNQAPVVTGVPTSRSLSEFLNHTFTAAATDADGHGVVFSLVAGPSGATIDPITGVFNWTPTEAQGGFTYTFKVRATDGYTSVDNTVVFTVNEVNTAPTLTLPGNTSILRGSVVSFNATATDPDTVFGFPNTLTYSFDSSPAGATINPATGAVTWVGMTNPGTYSFVIRVTDNGSPARSDVKTFTATVVAARIFEGELQIAGTNGKDVIDVAPSADPSAVNVKINNVLMGMFPLANISHGITARGFQGDDSIVIAPTIAKNAKLYGDEGNDYLVSGAGNDSLYGGIGNDALHGRTGNDFFDGGVGNDWLADNTGDDIYFFGPNWGVDLVTETTTGGHDTWDFSTANQSITLTASPGTVSAKAGLNRVTCDARAIYAGHKIENFNGSTVSDTFVNAMGIGNWNITGTDEGTLNTRLNYTAFENLTGSIYADNFRFRNGAGVSGSINGAAGVNTLDYSDYHMDVAVNLQQQTATDVTGTVTNIANVNGGLGNDVIVGDLKANVLLGNAGNDMIFGGGGADRLSGGTDDDILFGGSTSLTMNELNDIHNEWSSHHDYETRINHITGNIGGGLNGTSFLTAITLSSDIFLDNLTGASGDDWLFTGAKDKITDFGIGEIRTTL